MNVRPASRKALRIACVIVAILDGGRRVVLAPITGTEPIHDDKIALPAGSLGLARPSWIITAELNVPV